MFVSESDPGFQHDIVLSPGRQAYLVCIEGAMTLGTADAGKCSCRAWCLLVHAAMEAVGRGWSVFMSLRGPVPVACPAAAAAETKLGERDAAELVADKKPLHLSLQAGSEAGAHFMLIEMKKA